MDRTPSFLYLGERWYYFPGGTERTKEGGLCQRSKWNVRALLTISLVK